MDKNSGEFHDKDLQQAMRLAQTDTAKQLYTLLQQSDGDRLRSAMDQAAAGNMDEAQRLLRQLMRSPKAKELMRQLRGDDNG